MSPEQVQAIREAGAPCRDCGGPTVWISDAWTTCPSCVTRSREELFRALRVGSHAGALDRIRALLADREQREKEIARLAACARDTADRIEAHAHGHSVVEWAVASLREFAEAVAALAVAPKEEA